MIENPFFHRKAIRDPEYFHDREMEIEQILKMLAKGECVSVTGPRKIGKTSLLLNVCQPQVMEQYGLDPAHCLLVYFNCEGLGNLDQEAIYVRILEQIVEKAAQQGYKFAVPGRLDSYISFERALVAILNQGLKVVLLFDEFELLSGNRNLGSEFFSGLRALANRFDVAYVTVSQQSLLALPQTEESSPFFNIFAPLELGLFDEAASRELIDNYMRKAKAVLLEEVISMVLALGGGHPFFLQVAGYWAFELQATLLDIRAKKGNHLETKDLHILVQAVRDQVESHFEYYWGHLTSQEQLALATLPAIQSEESYRKQLETLTYLCLVVKENGRHSYFSPLLRDFVRRQTEAEVERGPSKVEAEGKRGKEGKSTTLEGTFGADAPARGAQFVVLDALLIASCFGFLFALALALVANYAPLFWLTGFLVLAIAILLLARSILRRR
jgi:hypothetical protein